MPREPKCRRVAFEPVVNCFSPQGIPSSAMEEVVLKLEELEAIRLKDYLSLDQEDSALMMSVSRPTFQRILTEAHEKVAEALITGKAIRIAGGNYCLGHGFCRKNDRHLESDENCPSSDLPFSDELPNQMVRTKIAICTSSDGSDAPVADHFGRCSFFWVWDAENRSSHFIPNPTGTSGCGAGTDAARRLAAEGVGTIITHKIGPRAFFSLQRLGIRVYAINLNESIRTTLLKLEQDQLKELSSPNS